MGIFGTFTPAGTDVGGTLTTISTMKFEYLTTLGIAAIVIFLGHFFVKHSKLLQRFAIPAPVVSGLLVSVLLSTVKALGILSVSFDKGTIQDLCQNVFFMCVGYGFSAAVAKKAGAKLCIKIALIAVLLCALQNVVGLSVGSLVGMNPLLSLQCSSAAMSGGIGNVSAFGPEFEQMGAVGATTVGVAAATVGNVLGSLIGGPVAVFLISRHHLKAKPEDNFEILEATTAKSEIINSNFVKAFALVLLITASGRIFSLLFSFIPNISIPKFIGCEFAGAVIRNIMEKKKVRTYVAEVNAIEHMFLELYLALVLMSIDITQMAPVAGQMGIVLLAQAVLMILFGVFVAFNLLGRDYGAAVMTAGCCGWGCGAGPNALANEKAVMDEYGWHSVAWVIYTSLSLLVVSAHNPIVISLLANLFG